MVNSLKSVLISASLVVSGIVIIAVIHGYDDNMRSKYGVTQSNDGEFYTMRSERVPFYLVGVAHTGRATVLGAAFILAGLALAATSPWLRSRCDGRTRPEPP